MDNHAQFIENEPIFAVTDSASVRIVFVGSKIQFPDCLSRTIAAEIDGCTALRLSGFAELATAIAGDTGLRPQLLVVDDSLWPAVDAELAQFALANPQTAIAIAFRDAARMNRMVLASSGLPKRISFLPMDLNIESWLTILRLVLTGYPFVPSEILLSHDAVSASTAPTPAPQSGALDKLTPREREVLALVAEGLQNKHIAGKLGLSEHTVKLHLHHVISKLGARNRTDAALRYRRQSGA